MSAQKPMVRPCSCGKAPRFVKAKRAGVHTLQLMCKCGQPCGAVLMYTRREDESRMRQAGIDGWNMSA
jgi:hypothetical protein